MKISSLRSLKRDQRRLIVQNHEISAGTSGTQPAVSTVRYCVYLLRSDHWQGLSRSTPHRAPAAIWDEAEKASVEKEMAALAGGPGAQQQRWRLRFDKSNFFFLPKHKEKQTAHQGTRDLLPSGGIIVAVY